MVASVVQLQALDAPLVLQDKGHLHPDLVLSYFAVANVNFLILDPSARYVVQRLSRTSDTNLQRIIKTLC